MEGNDRRPRASTTTSKLIRLFVVIQSLWFIVVYPVVPSSVDGFLVEFAAGMFLVVILFGCGRAIVWLSSQSTHVFAFRLLAAVLALSAGIAIFAMTYEFRDRLSAKPLYFRVCRPIEACWH